MIIDEPRCPYCSAMLTKLPESESNCPECGSVILFYKEYNSPETGKIYLYRKDEKIDIDRVFRTGVIRVLIEIGLPFFIMLPISIFHFIFVHIIIKYFSLEHSIVVGKTVLTGVLLAEAFIFIVVYKFFIKHKNKQ